MCTHASIAALEEVTFLFSPPHAQVEGAACELNIRCQTLETNSDVNTMWCLIERSNTNPRRNVSMVCVKSLVYLPIYYFITENDTPFPTTCPYLTLCRLL